MRETLRWPLLIAASGLALGALALLDAPGPALAVPALWFLLVCTGMAFLPLLGTRLGLPLGLGLVLVTSAALDTMVATALTIAGSFSGTGVFLALGGLCLIGCGLQVTEPETGAWRRLANEVPVPVLVIGALSLGLGIAVVKQFSGTDGGYPSQPSLEAVSAPPAVAPVAAGGAQGKSRKTKRPEKRKTKRPEKKSATPDAGATTKKRSPAAIQPASEPVASSPAPGGSGAGGSNDPPRQVQNDPPPQAEHGIGHGEDWHGIAPGGG